MKKVVPVVLTLLALTSCATIDQRAEISKLESAADEYRRCTVETSRSAAVTASKAIQMCRKYRQNLLIAVWQDRRNYDKSKFFDTYALAVEEQALAEIDERDGHGQR